MSPEGRHIFSEFKHSHKGEYDSLLTGTAEQRGLGRL